MRKICVIITGRAPYSRLKSVLTAISEHPGTELQLIVTASTLLDRYGCISVIKQDGFKINESFYCVVDGGTPETMVTTAGVFLIQLTSMLQRLMPDCVLVHADRYEALAIAQAAAYMNIPVAHTQGGEVSGSIDNKVRNAITMLADIHFPTTEMSATRITSMGVNPSRVWNVGCTAIDTIADINMAITSDWFLKMPGVGMKIDWRNPYIVVMQHPVTTEYMDTERQISETLIAIKALGMQTVWMWPNVDAGTEKISNMLRRIREYNESKNVRFVINLSPEKFAQLTANSVCLIGNTSFGIREGAYLGMPYVCVGTRQNGREHSNNVTFVDYNAIDIIAAVNEIRANCQLNPWMRDRVTWGDGGAGKKIAEILEKL